ncbi:MAG: 50S ribosomal protein L30 [Chloroflexi bacterium]|nr:50S ribosomal protein L30 [Chloroflexota bacterium]
MAKVRIQWVKSAIGYNHNQRLVLEALGLRRLNQTVVHEDSPTIRGMVHKIRHMLKVSAEVNTSEAK